MRRNSRHAVLCLLVLPLLRAAPGADLNSDWIEGEDHSDGATRDYYNRAARLAWQNFMGDWRDADDVPQGPRPYASVVIKDTDTGRFIEWDVTRLVQDWRQPRPDNRPNQGFFLRLIDGAGKIDFASNEHPDQSKRPQLILHIGGSDDAARVVADTHLAKWTYRGHGSSELLRVGPDSHTLIRFKSDSLDQPGQAIKATLRLHTSRQYGDATVGVFRCRQGHDAPETPPRKGLAAEFPGDRGIGSHKSAVFATGFESTDWPKEWTRAGEMRVIDTIASDEARQFAPFSGKALRVRIVEGANGALNTLFKFRDETGSEPEEVYFRYYLRLGADWNQTIEGGKMPGLSGTYGVAGWGGRKSDGRNGWSARGLFQRTIPAGFNPLASTTPIGTYCYHADMKGRYGDNFIWQYGYRGYLKNNQWYCVETYVKLNTPGRHDGVLRGWIDGRPAFEKTDLRYRLTDKLRIEQVWMNIYHGGKRPSPHDQHAFIDNIVIAREYIGPMEKSER